PPGGPKMPYGNRGSVREPVRFRRRPFLHDGALPFPNVLAEEIGEDALTARGTAWLDRIFSPLVTLGVFLGQILRADPSGRAARAPPGGGPAAPPAPPPARAPSARPRRLLPEHFSADGPRQRGRALDARGDPPWLWKRRRVPIYDGPSVAMPDPPAHQAAYPQP